MDRDTDERDGCRIVPDLLADGRFQRPGAGWALGVEFGTA